MKILLVYDIHGNYQALKEVLAEEDYDRLYCMGDIVDYGASPEECVTEMIDKADIVIRENHDDAVTTGADCGCSYEIKDLSEEVRSITKELLSENSMGYLNELPFEEKEGDIFSTHASKGDLYKYLKPDTPEKKFTDFSDVDQDIIILGRTHIPMDRTIDGKRLLNPGSLGQPRDGDPRASYAVFEDGEVKFKRKTYDIEKAKRRLDEKGFPERTKRILDAGKVVP
ncbi:MAG: metallophosphoesterase family protein [Candidatus Thermoplasmatota archaeon]|nr:metallophosphoesterase family protein [Candidatus Thermoplasmatota archaeon]